MTSVKEGFKQVLGALPFTAELDWYLRLRGAPVRGFKLDQLDEVLADWQAQAAASPHISNSGRKVFIFSTLRYWVSHTALMGLTFAGLGHDVTLSYIPYNDWTSPVSPYDLRQRGLYVRKVLRQAEPTIKVLPLLEQPSTSHLPEELQQAVQAVTIRDVQYTEQLEEIDIHGDLYALRLERNLDAAQAAFQWMERDRPDVLITPNGMILEFGAVYEVAKQLNIPVVSYEFGEQRQRIWFSQNSSVMLQDTDAVWAARKNKPFTNEQLEKVKDLFAARQGATLWQNFSRQWQEASSEGEAGVREKLDLDERPIILLAANVIGDSLTLGRQVFSDSMTDWVKRTVSFFLDKQDVQFILRSHPGERYLNGPSIIAEAEKVIPELPENFRIISAQNPINTYDLVSIADLGLVYTTTVGMEMAMSGLPVVVTGKTHYRGKGFTIDPTSWDEYFSTLEKALESPKKTKPPEEQVNLAWQYAYNFFFSFPRPFPWHLWYFWDDVPEQPISEVLSPEGLKKFADTFDYMVGKPVDWAEL
ncbi:MAG: hypothetical protein OEV06_00110 [Anaerolineae bacterium]|nr:hypothetical protein [Anaerolineae bacterium]